LKISTTTIKQLIEKLGPLILDTAPVVGAIRKVVSNARTGSDELRVENLENAMRFQAALNDKVDAQLKVVETLLQKIQRSLKVLTIASIGAAIVAGLALAIAIIG
jgi:hypothetical protein